MNWTFCCKISKNFPYQLLGLVEKDFQRLCGFFEEATYDFKTAYTFNLFGSGGNTGSGCGDIL